NQCDIAVLGTQHLQSFDAVRGATTSMAAVLQNRLERSANQRVVIHDQDRSAGVSQWFRHSRPLPESRIEDRGSRIEDRGSRMESVNSRSSIFHPQFSIPYDFSTITLKILGNNHWYQELRRPHPGRT